MFINKSLHILNYCLLKNNAIMQFRKLVGLTLILFLAMSTNIFAQKKKSQIPRMETKVQINGVADLEIKYGAPSVNNRKVWGNLVAYDKVWETGANAASTFEVNKDVLIEGYRLQAGKYSLFTIPRANGNWTIIFNKEANQWGAYSYDRNEDALQVNVKAKAANMTEMMKITASSGGKVTIMWEKLKVSFKVSTN